MKPTTEKLTAALEYLDRMRAAKDKCAIMKKNFDATWDENGGREHTFKRLKLAWETDDRDYLDKVNRIERARYSLKEAEQKEWLEKYWWQEAWQLAVESLSASPIEDDDADGFAIESRYREENSVMKLPMYHDDRTVTYWSRYHDRWVRHAVDIPDREYARMPQWVRKMVMRHVGTRSSDDHTAIVYMESIGHINTDSDHCSYPGSGAGQFTLESAKGL